MDYIVSDVETTGATNDTYGNPFTDDNRLIIVGAYNSVNSEYLDWFIDIADTPYGGIVGDTFLYFSREPLPLLVGFSYKFDLHWKRRYGILPLPKNPIWDVQLAHFLITGQKHPYPSLNDVTAYYGLGQKLDIVKTEYWDKGIDTDQVPQPILKEYLKQDVMLTQQAFECQLKYLKDKPQLKRLIWYNCQDLKVTAEMEWNGLKYDLQRSKDLGIKIEGRLRELDEVLFGCVDSVPINWSSGYHVSCVLYGGVVNVDRRETYLFHYRDEKRPPKEKTRTATTSYTFPRLVDPIKGSELKKEGYWATSEGILRKLKAHGNAKAIIDALLERTILETKLSRYYYGFPKLYEEMGWTNSLIHTNLNHVVAQTGRLSSNKPNVQNLEEQMRECVITRF